MIDSLNLIFLETGGLNDLALAGLTTFAGFLFLISDLILGRSDFDLPPFFFLFLPSESESLLDFDLDFTLLFSVGV